MNENANSWRSSTGTAWQHVACAIRCVAATLAPATGVDWLAAQLAVSVQRGRAQRANTNTPPPHLKQRLRRERQPARALGDAVC